MVATSSASPYFSGIALSAPLLVCRTPRQSSLRSVSSTHSRRSLEKSESFGSCSSSSKECRRVTFERPQNDEILNSDRSLEEGNLQLDIFNYEPEEPIEPLYMTPFEILKIRSQARQQAAHFAQIYPSYVAEINNLFEKSIPELLNENQVGTLRRRRRRHDPFDVAFECVEREDDIFFEMEQKQQCDTQQWNNNDDDDNLDDSSYFCIMRGLETRISPMFRIHRRQTIKTVLDLQQEMKKAGCCAAQIQMGLRAVCVQATQKARTFASHQAAIDAFEVYALK